MVTQVTLDATRYGFDAYSRDVWLRRTKGDLSTKLNVATFHLVPRSDLSGKASADKPLTYTVTSTGVSVYKVVYGRVESEIKINNSHSEHQFFIDDLPKLFKSEVWPAKYVIDWIYTERPACPDAWAKLKKQHDGCLSEITKHENHQKLRLWDIGKNPKDTPYARRSDLEITVYSSFDTEAEISRGFVLGPVRMDVYHDLYYKLLELYENAYSKSSEKTAPGEEEYDLMEFEVDLPGQAAEFAEKALPTWDDYTFGIKDHAAFRKELEKKTTKTLADERRRLGYT